MDINKRWIPNLIAIWTGFGIMALGLEVFYDSAIIFILLGGLITVGSIIHVIIKSHYDVDDCLVETDDTKPKEERKSFEKSKKDYTKVDKIWESKE